MDYAIIAAGEGSRLVQEGIRCPKPLVRLDGTPLIKRLIDIFLRNNATSINIIVNEQMTEVQDYLRQLQIPVPFHLLVKSTPSSMHSFYELSRFIDGDQICLTTVDTIFREAEFASYYRSFEQDPTIDGLMAATAFVDDEKPLWIAADEQQRITQFLDAASPDSRFVSGGIYCLRRRAIDLLGKAIADGVSRMRNYQRLLVTQGLCLKVYPFSKIIDVDHAGDIVKAEAFINEK